MYILPFIVTLSLKPFTHQLFEVFMNGSVFMSV